jgi:hypothetical protein
LVEGSPPLLLFILLSIFHLSSTAFSLVCLDSSLASPRSPCLPTTRDALFHSIVSTHSLMATIDIVDYYLGTLLPSPESVRIDVSSISIPTLTKLGLLPFLHHSHGKPFIFCDVLKTVSGLPQSGLLSQLRLVALLTQHGFSETSTLMLFRHHTHSTAFTLVVDDFLVRYSHPSELDHLVSCLSTLYELKVHRDLPTSATPLIILPPPPHPV